jgi:DNA-binding transcriptional MerR regulator/methylmalonyl-CoA mutase cobalamin-binding subunit
MNDRTAQRTLTVAIAAVERDTGLSKDTLRVWERRYGFPQPERDANGERVYPLEQLDKLRLLKRLLDQGFRPGRIIGLPVAELQLLSEGVTAAPRAATTLAATDDLDRYLQCLTGHRLDDLRRQLSQALLRLGLARFVTDVVAPLTGLVGDAWSRGRLQVYEEHLYTEAVQAILRGATATIPAAGGSPRVLLTTFPQEPHGLGVLMAEAMFALDGASCVPLGVQTPVWEIAAAARSQRVDIVALSFTPVVNPNQVVEGLAELRAQLPAEIEIWVGGSAPVLRRRPPHDVQVLESLAGITEALGGWRQRRADGLKFAAA